MEIQNVILHNLIKAEGNTKVELDDRKKENAINESAKQLSKGINEKFNATGLNMGHFKLIKHDDDPLPHFEYLLNKYYLEGKFDNFVDFTVSAARHLRSKLMEAPKAKGGHIWFNHYLHQGVSFLSIVMLREKTVMRIDELELAEFDSVDLDKLHMAARINLTRWIAAKDEPGRYISFKIGRDAKKVTDYFAKFIGCEEFTESKDDTKALIKIIADYCSHHKFKDETAEKVKSTVYEQITEWVKEEQTTTIQIDRLSKLLDSSFLDENTPEKELNKLVSIAQNDPYHLNNEITPDKTQLRRLKRYSGKSKDVSISFSSVLLNKSVIYKDGSLTISADALPKSLKKELDKPKKADKK